VQHTCMRLSRCKLMQLITQERGLQAAYQSLLPMTSCSWQCIWVQLFTLAVSTAQKGRGCCGSPREPAGPRLTAEAGTQ
jgi:hypothetical protein